MKSQSVLLCPVVHLDCNDGHAQNCCQDLSPIAEPGDGRGRVAVHSAVEGDKVWGGHLLVG